VTVRLIFNVSLGPKDIGLSCTTEGLILKAPEPVEPFFWSERDASVKDHDEAAETADRDVEMSRRDEERRRILTEGRMCSSDCAVGVEVVVAER
jgi:hypothetical protein